MTNIRHYIIKTLGTFFYLGYFPFIPGTAASAVAIFLFYLIRGGILTQALFTILFLLIGLLVSGKAEEIFAQKDARCIVIDEVAGMFLALMFIPYNLKIAISAFILFRILDALKPYPADKIQNLKSSLGIMGDDIIAGLYTNLILQLVLRLASFKIS